MSGSDVDVVVIGAGGFGAAAAWHLSAAGAKVTVLDRHGPVSQTAPRAAGLTMLALADPLAHGLQRRSLELLARFDDEVGPGLELTRAGSLHLAISEDVASDLASTVVNAKALGADIDLVDTEDIESRWPMLDARGVVAASFSPPDVYFRPGTLPSSYLDAAIRLGAGFRADTPVIGIESRTGGVRVRTSSGPIDGDVVVDAAGAWMGAVAATAGIRVPLVPVRHQLLVTEPVAGYADAPIVRILDRNIYTRPCDGGILVGGYEPHPLAVDRLPDDVAELILDPRVPEGMREEAAAWLRPLRGAEVAEVRGGIPTMTADGRMLFGWIPDLPGLLVVGGCNVGGLSVSPVIGESVARLVAGEGPWLDLSPLDPTRFTDVDDAVIRHRALASYAGRYRVEV